MLRKRCFWAHFWLNDTHQNVELLPSFGKIDFAVNQIWVANLNKSQVLGKGIESEMKFPSIARIWFCQKTQTCTMYIVQINNFWWCYWTVLALPFWWAKRDLLGARGQCRGCKEEWPLQVLTCQLESTEDQLS